MERDTKVIMSYSACWSLLYGMLKNENPIKKLQIEAILKNDTIGIKCGDLNEWFIRESPNAELSALFDKLFDVRKADDRLVELIKLARVDTSGNVKVYSYYDYDIVCVKFRMPYTTNTEYITVFRSSLYVSTCNPENVTKWLENALV